MKRLRDDLSDALDQFEGSLNEVVPGRERAWAEGVGAALGRVEEVLRRHGPDAEGPAGLFAEVDLTRPSFVRVVSALRREHQELPDQAAAFRNELRTAA